jgi:IS605 OrfB family transposase
VRLLDQNWQGYVAACAARESDPSRFLGCPKLPGYKDKQQGRNLLSYTIQALSLPALERGLIMPSMLGITVKTKCQSVQQVRIVPRLGFYVIEVIYEKQPITAAVNPALRIDQYLHTASRRIIDLLIAEGIGTLCIGKNPLWKQEANLGRRTNQLVVSVPHARFIEMLTYKAQLVGIQVIETEESYTGKASFLDGDALPIYDAQRQEAPAFSGGRVKRGLYRAADGTPINADVNGAYNIMRKVAPEAFAQGSRGCVVHPIRLAV